MNNVMVSKKNIITLIIILIIIALAIYFGILPQTKKVASVYKDNKYKEAQYSQLQQELVNIQNLSKTSDNSMIDKVINYIPKKDQTNFITQAEALAKQTNNKVNSIKFDDTKTKYLTVAGTQEQVFSIDIAGDYNSINGFLKGMSELTQYNNIYNVSIAAESDQTTANIIGAIYTRKD